MVTRTGLKVYVGTNGTPRPVPRLGPTPRWPDGRPRLGAARADGTGATEPHEPVEDGVSVPMDATALEQRGRRARVAPLRRGAGALSTAAADVLQRDPMFLSCKARMARVSSSSPRLPVRGQPDSSACSSCWAAGTATAAIYTDGRKHLGQLQGNDDNPSSMASRSAAGGRRLRGDLRPVQREFGSTTAACATEQLKLLERFTRVEPPRALRGTIDDRARTPSLEEQLDVTGSREERRTYLCQDNRP